MALGIVTFGGSTLFQEAGGAMNEMAEYHAAKRRFPDLEPEERAQAFYKLDDKEKGQLIIDAMNRGDIDYDGAMVTGGLNAGFDLVSNFFVLGKTLKGGKAATKFLPKKFARMFGQKAYQKATQYALGAAAKGLPWAMGSEVLTENLQELTSMYHVGKNTTNVDNQYTGFFKDVFSQDGLKRIAETTFASAIVPGALVGSANITGMTYSTAKSMSMDYLAKNDPSHLRNWVNKRKKYIQSMVDKKMMPQQEANNQMDLLEYTEMVQNDTKNKYVTGDNKKKIFNNLVNQTKLQDELALLEENKNQTDKDKNNVLDIKEKLQDIKNKNADIRFLDNLDASGKTFAQWINEQKEGLFADKKLNLFDTVDELRTYVSGRIKSIKKQLKKDPKNKKLAGELKELQSNSLKDLQSLDADGNGANTGNNAWELETTLVVTQFTTRLCTLY